MTQFNERVRALVLHSGGADCIVPNDTQVSFFEQLNAEHDRPHDRWYFSVWPHSCKKVTSKFPSVKEESKAGGYYPSWTQGLKDEIDGQMGQRLILAAREHLLGQPAPEMDGPVLVSPLVHGDETGDSSPWRAIESFSELADGTIALHLQEGGSLASNASDAPFAMTFIDHKPAGICDTRDIENPCGMTWNAQSFTQNAETLESNLRSMSSYEIPLSEDFTVFGTTHLKMRLRVEDAAAFNGGGIVAMLRYTPPDAPQNFQGWLVTQGGQFFYLLDNEGRKELDIKLDTRVMTFERGGKLRLDLSNMSTYVGNMPWFHPHTSPYRLELEVDSAHPAVLEIPVSSLFESLPLADVAPLNGD